MPRVEDGKLLVTVDNVQIAGLTVSVDDLPNAIGDRLTDIEIPVEGLPEGLVLSDATVVDGRGAHHRGRHRRRPAHRGAPGWVGSVQRPRPLG